MTAPLALGTMNFGKRTPEAEAVKILEHAVAQGVTVFDTANVYNAGASERIVGKALKGHRATITIATKAGLDRGEGLSPDALMRAVDGSLQRLGVDAIDLFYLHAPDAKTPIEQTLDGLAALFAAGKIKQFGVSNYAAWQILEIRHLAFARSLPAPVISQVLYNVLIRDVEVEYLPFSRRHKLHTTVYNPLAGGLLSGKHDLAKPAAPGSRFASNPMYPGRYWTPRMFERVTALATVARDEGMSLLELSYAWLAHRDGVDSILVGPASIAHFDDAQRACAKTLSPDALQRIDALHLAERGSDTTYVR